MPNVINKTGGPVFLKGHGVIRAGQDSVEVKSSDGLTAAIEAGVLAEAEARAAAPKGADKTNPKEG